MFSWEKEREISEVRYCSCLVFKSRLTLLQLNGLELTILLCTWEVPGKNTGEGCHFLLQGIFPTQPSNPCLLHWQVDFTYHWGTRKALDVLINYMEKFIHNEYMLIYKCSGDYTQFKYLTILDVNYSFPGDSDSKESACNTGDPSSIPGSGRCPG